MQALFKMRNNCPRQNNWYVLLWLIFPPLSNKHDFTCIFSLVSPFWYHLNLCNDHFIWLIKIKSSSIHFFPKWVWIRYSLILKLKPKWTTYIALINQGHQETVYLAHLTHTCMFFPTLVATYFSYWGGLQRRAGFVPRQKTHFYTAVSKVCLLCFKCSKIPCK